MSAHWMFRAREHPFAIYFQRDLCCHDGTRRWCTDARVSRQGTLSERPLSFRPSARRNGAARFAHCSAD